MRPEDEKRMYQSMLFALKKIADAPDVEGSPELEEAQKLARAVVSIEARQQAGEATYYEFKQSGIKGEYYTIAFPDGSEVIGPWPQNEDDWRALGRLYADWMDNTPDVERFMKPREGE